jgi:arginyl-tRNA synthetase
MTGSIAEVWRDGLVRAVQGKWGIDVSDEAFQPLLVPTQDLRHGDYACGVCFKLAKPLRSPPPKLAAELARSIEEARFPHLAKVEAAGGYVNLSLDNAYLAALLDRIHERPGDHGRSSRHAGVKILFEYVSANPTGPVTIAAARQAAVGDTLARTLRFAGAEVLREYYINDTGGQIHNLGLSLLARAAESSGRSVPFPEEGYRGEYIKDLAERFLAERGPGLLDLPDAAQICARFACGELIEGIKADLKRFGVEFDSFASQDAIEKSGKVDRVLDDLRSKGLVAERDGALWFLSTRLGDDKDRVLVKRDGAYTYLAPDLAYHRDKFDRGYDRLIDIMGPDHHQHAKELALGLGVLGFEARRLRVLILQHCRLLRAGEEVKMSKRLATYVTLSELLDEAGVDAARYFFVMRRPDTHLDFDIDVAKKQSLDNPVYYAQYAHARICSVYEKARERGMLRPEDLREGVYSGQADASKLGEGERNLIRLLERFPQAVIDAAEDLDTTKITSYVYSLSGAFQSYYTEGNKDASKRIVSEDPTTTACRLRVAGGVQIVLRTALGLLGVSAPASM